MQHIYHDGGRKAAGYKGTTGDCVVRAIAIATEMPYQTIYDLANTYAARERTSKRRRRKSSARTGVHRATIRRLLEDLGWTWVPTMRIGSGCTVHLADGELPMGRLIVSVSKHLTAVIDGVIYDTHDPQREVTWFRPDDGTLKKGEQRTPNGLMSVQRRCVYGYWHTP